MIKSNFSADSDDENNFEPPALSDYAVALLENEKTLSKKVNFMKSPSPTEQIQNNNNSNNNHNNNNSFSVTSHTTHSDYESIFTKNITNTDTYTTSSPRRSNLQLKDHSLRLKNSIRRNKIFKLGPPKRAMDSEVDMDIEIEDNSPEPQEQPQEQHRGEAKAAEDQVIPRKEKQQPEISSNFDFEGLNPYQYAKKYNLSSNELVELSKVYLKQQKNESRLNSSLNSPIRLKQVLNTKFGENSINDSINNSLNNSISNSVNNPIKIFNDEKENLIEKEFNSNNANNFKQYKRDPLNEIQTNNQLNLPQQHQQQQQQQKSRTLIVNNKQYEKLELLGKGGSSKVFKVKSINNKVYAIKKIIFDEFDELSITGFKNEINLLNKLRHEERVVKLIDYSLGQGSLLLVMECGDIDLSTILHKRLELPLDIEFVRFYSNEILKCVKAVHDNGIIHSDLKPANFLFVKGILKIIDFGISNAVPEHTMNIYRENQIGTPNYMAPEALIDLNSEINDSNNSKENSRLWKVGKSSDIWSCGCIIYQMIYGNPPYGNYQGSQRLLAIMNPKVKIAYPEFGNGGIRIPKSLIDTVKSCLVRDPNKRSNLNDLLCNSFLKPRIISENFINELIKNAINFGIEKKSVNNDEIRDLATDVWKRINDLNL